MKTKRQLEDRIAELEACVRELDKAVTSLSSEVGMEIILPGVHRDAPNGDAPRLFGEDGIAERLMRIMEPALRKHGAKLSHTIPAKSIRLHDNSYRVQGDRILVPVIWGEVMVEIADAAAEFGRLCYAEGVEHGSNLLTRMSRGELTAEELEDGVEKAKSRQERKDWRALVKTGEQ